MKIELTQEQYNFIRTLRDKHHPDLSITSFVDIQYGWSIQHKHTKRDRVITSPIPVDESVYYNVWTVILTVDDIDSKELSLLLLL